MAKGYDVTDAMLKTANVKLLVSRTICPGKYMVLVAGEVADVTSSVDAGAMKAGDSFVDKFVIPNVHPDVLPAIQGTAPIMQLEALGVLETFSVASCIEAADACVKTADVKLLEIKLAMAMGGKGLVTFTGSVAACAAAVESGAANAGEKGLLVSKILIPQPRPELLKDLI
jgi:microcompartment protein CcmL/EutN